MTIKDTYRASLVRRWHANPFMCDVHDEVGAIKYAIAHDLGEHKTGDWPWEFKRDNPDLAAQEAKIGTEYVTHLGFSHDVTRTEIDRVKLCDRLDAYMTAQHHKPHLMQREDWRADRRRLLLDAERLGVEGRVREAI